MHPKFPFVAVGAFLLFGLLLGSWDLNIRFANRGGVALHTQEAAMTGQIVGTTLEGIRNNCTGNVQALAVMEKLKAAYQSTPQTVAGLTAYQAVVAQTKPKVIAPLVEPIRSDTVAYFRSLESIVERHTMSLRSKETAEQNVAGGLLTRVRRDWGLSSSP